MLTESKLTDGKLRLFDANRLEHEGIGINDVQVLFQSHPTRTQADLMLTGTTEDGGDLHIAGTLALQQHGRSNASIPRQFDGILRFHQWDIAYWLNRTGQSAATSTQTTTRRGNISAGLHLDFPPDAKGFNVIVSDLNTDLGWLLIRGHIMVEGGGTDHPAYAVKLSTSPVSSKTFFDHIPPSWIPKTIHAAVDEHELTGTVELESVTLRGRIDVLRVPDEWQVAAKVLHASGGWEKTRTLIRNVSVTVWLDSTRANITDLSGDMNGVHVTSSKLSVSDLNLRPIVDARFLAEGPLDNVMAVVEHFSEGTGAHDALRTVRDATGTLQVAVHVNGPIIPRPNLRMISAELYLQDMGAHIAKAMTIGQLNGSFAADSRLVGIKHVRGVVQGIHFEAEGNIDVAAPNRVNTLKVNMSSDGTAIQELLATYLPALSHMHIDGPAHSTMFLSGIAALVHCRGTLDVTDAEIIVPSLLDKKPGVPGLIEWEGKLFDGKRVVVDHLRLVVPHGEIRAAGQLELGHTPKFHVKLNAGPLSLRALQAIGVGTPISEGMLDASAFVSGEGTNWKLWVPSGWVSIHRAVVTLPGLDEQLRELSGRAQLTQGGLLVNELLFTMGESDFKLTGMVEHWRTQPRATFMVESSQLNVSDFVSKKTVDPDKRGSHVQEWIGSKKAAITFLVKQLRYDRLVLKTVSGEITVDQHKAKLNGLRGETKEGVLSGQVEGRFGAHNQMEIAAEMSVDGIPAQQVFSATDDNKERLQGNVSLKGVLQARIDATSPLQHTLSTGRDGIVVKVTKGRLQQDPVLTKALKILNLPSVLFGQVDFDVRGIPFDSLSARVVGSNGVFSSEDIVLNSPVIKVTGAGSADVKDNGLDLAVAVSPVAAYSDLAGKIPLFGQLFGEDHQGLTTAVFEAKGSLQNPDVAYLPLESLARGLTGYPRLAIDVLVNTIRLPPTALAYATE
ncbi:MAG TPA: AsmA-like C-terminal domain-containing protein [Nitrospira sp.]|nr:AsmA-like C-terminal domain-containing protein [Nitrospira sp.]